MSTWILTFSWIAILFLSISYWFQIWKIHVHKEVRDLSIPYHIFLAMGFGMLIITAWEEDSTIFLVKQIATFTPVLVIIAQIYWHRRDRWHDEQDPTCSGCEIELELDWTHCPYCGCKAERNEVPF